MLNAKSLGLCLGASTLSVVSLKYENSVFVEEEVLSHGHEGAPTDYLKTLAEKYRNRPAAVTGRKFRNLLELPQLTEAEAIEEALEVLVDPGIPVDAVISAGSETFIIYELDGNRKIKGIHTGSKCASGTGEFFLQQLRRMNVTPEDAVREALDAEPYHISGRCSVFCKSDCTHALNKGEPIGRVAAGLCKMMTEKILELMAKIKKKNVVFIGGVTKNRAVAKLLRLEIENLIIPKEAAYFEAYGAAVRAMKESGKSFREDSFKQAEPSFSFLKPLSQYEDLVTFKSAPRGKARENDVCTLGLDVGSTTTKAVLMHRADETILASCYLRTNGDPVGASKNCFREIQKQLQVPVKITGLGVTGSGRYISALYADTDGVINEIIAHAEAALHFDAEVDTIFEIGGQDAKYTYLVNGVPCDYAMNEACSAGTGSFLEESARESLGIETEEIGDIALKSQTPPNFNDQCAAFISSDIKSAVQEGIGVQDIVAGLVYSISLNYNNKVRGPRTAGKKVFMQGGVCYNKAVPTAMAAITGCAIIVPPDPGLMGAFGVALEMKRRQDLGILQQKDFDLGDLIDREVGYGKSFVCGGGKEKCDRKCEIQMVHVKGEKFPFGGACNRYYNMSGKNSEPETNGIRARDEMLFQQFGKNAAAEGSPTVGLNRSFMTFNLYPLYIRFFNEIGFRVVLPDRPLAAGTVRKGASFCHPYEQAHGYFLDLLEKNPDYIVLPHVRELYVPNALSRDHDMQATCQLLQSEPYCLREAFADLLEDRKVLYPIFNFSKGYDKQEKAFVELAAQMGVDREKAKAAYKIAVKEYEGFTSALREKGRAFLAELEKSPQRQAVVLFGRPYNALNADLNMGIPEKFSSRGIPVIPYDMLPFDGEEADRHMHWASGQLLTKAAKYVKKHPQLFGTWITNFSCGPDSLLQKYFRDIMGRKPSLTLELDSHTADAGITTRVEAFLDIVERYRKIKIDLAEEKPYSGLHTVVEGSGKQSAIKVVNGKGEKFPIKHEKVNLLMPSMGWMVTQLGAEALRNGGYNIVTMGEPDALALKYGRANTSCKECLPLILIMGSLERYLAQHELPEDEMTLCFVPSANGGCRLGQYCVALENHIKNKKMDNLALFTLGNENNYAGLDQKTLIQFAKTVTISDVMDDIYNSIYALACDRRQGLEIFMEQWEKILDCFRNRGNTEKTLRGAAAELKKIPLKKPYAEACKVMLCGEIYVRKERFASDPVMKALAQREIVMKVSPFNEWMFYVDYMVDRNILDAKHTFTERIVNKLQYYYKTHMDNKYRRILAESGLNDYGPIDIYGIMKAGEQFMSAYLGGDPIISCGSAMREIFHSFGGVVVIGPFACMQSRTTEAMLGKMLTPERKKRFDGTETPEGIGGIPFLAIETDGNVLPQIIEAKLETFALQSNRVWKSMMKNRQA